MAWRNEKRGQLSSAAFEAAVRRIPPPSPHNLRRWERRREKRQAAVGTAVAVGVSSSPAAPPACDGQLEALEGQLC